MAHIELIAALAAFAGIVLAWLSAPGTAQIAHRAPEPARSFEQLAA